MGVSFQKRGDPGKAVQKGAFKAGGDPHAPAEAGPKAQTTNLWVTFTSVGMAMIPLSLAMRDSKRSGPCQLLRTLITGEAASSEYSRTGEYRHIPR